MYYHQGYGGLKISHAQELIQPVSSSNKVNPLFKSILQEYTVAVNSHWPDITRLQDCDQKVTPIRLVCDKNQSDHSICYDKRLKDYINNRGNSNPWLIYGKQKPF